MDRLTGLFGFFALLGIAYVLSSNRKAIRWKTVVWGTTLQFAFAFIVLRGTWLSQQLTWVPFSPLVFLIVIVLQLLLLFFCGSRFLWFSPLMRSRLKVALGFEILVAGLKFQWISGLFEIMREVVQHLIAYSTEGSTFVFGSLGADRGKENLGFIFAFQVLPTIIFVASIFSILYYLGVMPVVIRKISNIVGRIMGSSGPESVSVAASIFMGQAEAPLTVRPFLSKMTYSELMTVMTSGMAHVAGGMMAAYVLVANVDVVHLLTAVVMTAPGAIMVAKILIPETDHPKTSSTLPLEIPRTDVNLLDAAARGANEGVHLAINVAGMLIAFIALVALSNGILGFLHHQLSLQAIRFPDSSNIWQFLAHYFPETLQEILGTLFRPIAWMMGVSWKDSFEVGNLLGTRMVLNEFVSFVKLGEIASTLEPRSLIISTFALCGFANFGSIAIQIGGIGSLAPTRRHDLARLGIRAMIGGTIANFLSATIAGMLL